MNLEPLKGVLPQVIYDQIPEIMDRFQVNTPLRLSRLLGQAKQETQFKVFSENLNYSLARMRAVFGSRLSHYTDAQLFPYVMNPIKFGNMIYANMLGNGNEASGDGYKYRGMGAIGLTGKAQFIELNHYVPEPDNIVTNPDLVATKYQMFSAGYYFKKHGLNELADNSYNNPEKINEITKKVNAASLGAENRLKYSMDFYEMIK